MVAAISLGCIGGLLVFLPAILEGITTPVGIGLVGVIFAVLWFFIAAFSVVASQLGIAKTLFNDYSNYPNVHWSIIIFTLISVGVIAIVKVNTILKSR